MTMRSHNPELTRLEEQHDAHFTYDPRAHTWCLSGPFRGGAYDESGPYWETDDVAATSFEEAQEAAIAYLRAYHEPA